MPLNTSHVKKLLERRGRVASERGLNDRAKNLFGTTRGLTISQTKQLVREMEKNKRLALTPTKKAQVESLLQRNRVLPPPERKSFDEISRLTGISKSQIKKINVGVRQGKGKVLATNPERKGAVVGLRKLLSSNPNISFQDAAKQLGVSTKQLQRILPQYKTSFATERKKARLLAIQILDTQTGQQLSNAEIAKQLGLKENYVMQNRKRRGRGSGHTTRQREMSKKFLRIIGLFTALNKESISIDLLMRVTRTTRPTAYASLKQLKSEGLIVEPYSGKYGITTRGVGIRNMHGREGGSFISSLNTMPLKELKTTLTMLEEIERFVPRDTINPIVIDSVKQKIKREIANKVINGSK